MAQEIIYAYFEPEDKEKEEKEGTLKHIKTLYKLKNQLKNNKSINYDFIDDMILKNEKIYLDNVNKKALIKLEKIRKNN